MGGVRNVAKGQKDFCAIAERYANRIVTGEVPACKIVKQACQRQLDDLERYRRGDGPWTFDPDKGNRVCKFIEKLQHIKGRWKTKTIELEDWQAFVLTTIFGWVDDEGLRRFRTAYIEVPRKNAKTTLSAGIALYMLCADGEPGPEIYSAAVTRDQARISWEIAQKMIKRDPNMAAMFDIEPMAHVIVRESVAGSFKPLARDADSLEGLNPHCAVVDEVHAHKTREVWDVLDVARGSRRQSLLLGITTAGDNRVGICYEQHTYVENVLGGRHVDDRYFGIIYSTDPGDDWTTEAAHRKANPNYGVSVLVDDIDMMCRRAMQSADSQNTFLTKRLNIWVSVASAYFNSLAWETLCKVDGLNIEDFIGEPCVFHLDLASKRDLTSRVIMFRKAEEYYVFAKHYLPSDAVERGNANYDFYRGWEKTGNLTVTEGNITDYSFVERDLLDDVAKFKPLAVGVDPNYNAGQFTTRMMEEGVPMLNISQNVATLSEPMQQVDALIVAGKIHHCGDPVLSWNMANVTAKKDAKNNVYPRKARDGNKIDAAVALISAMSVLSKHDGSGSVYETRGLRVI